MKMSHELISFDKTVSVSTNFSVNNFFPNIQDILSEFQKKNPIDKEKPP